MFSKVELQVIAKTLLQRREWLVKNINNPDLAAAKGQHQQTLDVIESTLSKITAFLKSSNAETAAPITSPAAKPAKIKSTQHRLELPPEQIRVLVVDDDNFMSSLLQTILQSSGITQVDIAEDGLKAITMLYDANPVYDLVLCDWNMPIKSGIDVHNAMRAAERYINTCFMLVTAVTEAKQIRAAIEEGVDDYIVKPVDEQKIINKIARHFPKIKMKE